MKEYTVIQAWVVEKLVEQVNEHIKQGWQPCGGIAVAYDATDIGGQSVSQAIFCQAMVR